MKIATKFLWLYAVTGILRIIFGFLGCINNGSLRVFAVFFLLISSFIQLIFTTIDSEKSDEMSENNLKEAKYRTSNITRIIILCTLTVILGISRFPFATSFMNLLSDDWTIMLFYSAYVVFGIEDIITSIIFRKLEAE